MTPFEKAGYSKYTKFRVIGEGFFDLEKGDIVTLEEDEGGYLCCFKTPCGRRSWCWLPDTTHLGGSEDLEVYEEEV